MNMSLAHNNTTTKLINKYNEKIAVDRIHPPQNYKTFQKGYTFFG